MSEHKLMSLGPDIWFDTSYTCVCGYGSLLAFFLLDVVPPSQKKLVEAHVQAWVNG